MDNGTHGDYTKRQACRVLGICERTLDRMIRRGDIHAYKLTDGKTGAVRIIPASVDAFRERRRIKSLAG